MTLVDPGSKEHTISQAALYERMNELSARATAQINAVADSIESVTRHVDNCLTLIGQAERLIDPPSPTFLQRVGLLFLSLFRSMGLVK
jgi:hypothetical protein